MKLRWELVINLGITFKYQEKYKSTLCLVTSFIIHSLKDSLLAADKVARRAVKDGGKKLADANKAVNKARRLANRALDFEENEDDALASSDYDLLLSAAGAVEKYVNINSSYTQTFVVPAGSAFVWKARVRKNDIAFAVREIRDNDTPIDLEPLIKYRSEAPIQGTYYYIMHTFILFNKHNITLITYYLI